MPYTVRRLNQADLASYRALRLQALLECPSAFGATPEGDKKLSDAQVLARFESTPGQAMWGGFDEDGRLCATLGMYRDLGEKQAHKASIFAVYVQPAARGHQLGRKLMEAAIAHGRILGLRQILLGCNADNHSALRLYEQAGFRSYGVEPAAICVNGIFFDEVLMALRLD